jgi:hypothetical protein
LELGRISLKVGNRFEDHVVLIQLRVQRGNLALAESVVQRLIDHLRRNAHARSG